MHQTSIEDRLQSLENSQRQLSSRVEQLENVSNPGAAQKGSNSSMQLQDTVDQSPDPEP
jgi:hypothetical protein